MKKEKTFKELVFDLIIAMLVTIVSAFSYGWVALVMYRWFVLPIIGWPHLSYSQMTGIIAFVSVFFSKSTSIKEEYQLEASEMYLKSLLTPWVCLFVGWMVHIFIS